MPSIGLKARSVKLIRHRGSWNSDFEQEKKKLEKALGASAVEIQHIGSTAIPGIFAKPVIDIIVGTPSLKIAQDSVKKLETIGYVHKTKFRHPYQQLLVVKGNDTQRTHHVHIAKHKGDIWKRLTLFRDYMNEYPREARRYSDFKKRLAKRFPNDRKSYTNSKALFVKEILNKAKKKSK